MPPESGNGAPPTPPVAEVPIEVEPDPPAAVSRVDRRLPDPRASLPDFHFMGPKDEFVHSLENGGAGVPLAVVAKRWRRSYEALRVEAMGDLLPEKPNEPRGYKAGTSWRELRVNYLERMWRASEDRSIAAVAEGQAKLEATYVRLAEALVARITKTMIARQGTLIDVKDDLALAKLLDVANKIQRRNYGLPETSHEVRGRVEFVRTVVVKFTQIVRRYVREPETVRAIAGDLRQLEAEFELLESTPPSSGG